METKLTLFWSQKNVFIKKDTPSTISIDSDNVLDIIPGYLSFYLEGSISWIEGRFLPTEDVEKYEFYQRHPFSSLSEENRQPSFDMLVHNPSSFIPHGHEIVVLSISQLKSVQLEYYFCENMTKVYPKLILNTISSKVDEDHKEKERKEFIFMNGNPMDFIELLKCFTPLSQKDEDTFILDHSSSLEAQKLESVRNKKTKLVSFSKEKIHGIVEETAWNILEGFSGLTHFARSFMNDKNPSEGQRRPTKESPEYLDLFQNFHIPNDIILEPSWRGNPVTVEMFMSSFDKEGRLCNVEELKRRIFCGGIEDQLRPLIWPYLFELHDWNSSTAEREIKLNEYRQMYTKICPNCSSETQHRIFKDVVRTDRNVPYYSSAITLDLIEGKVGQKGLDRLMELLICYCQIHSEIGYVQGMSDLASPFNYVFQENGAYAYYSFTRLMESRYQDYFKEDSSSPIQHILHLLLCLIRIVLPHLYEHFVKLNCTQLFFCYRWFLIRFKREFTFDETLLLWEVLATNPYSKSYEWFIALGLLKSQEDWIINNCSHFDDVLQRLNTMSNISLIDILKLAEELWFKFKYLAPFINLPYLNALIA